MTRLFARSNLTTTDGLVRLRRVERSVTRPLVGRNVLSVQMAKSLRRTYMTAVRRWSTTMVGPGMDSLSPMPLTFLQKHKNESMLIYGSNGVEPVFVSRITFRRERSGSDLLQEETSVGSEALRLPVRCAFLNTLRVNPKYREMGLATLAVAYRAELAAVLGFKQLCTLIAPDRRWVRFWTESLGFQIESDDVMCRFDGVNVCRAVYLTRVIGRSFSLTLDDHITVAQRKLEAKGFALKLSKPLVAVQVLRAHNLTLGHEGLRFRA